MSFVENRTTVSTLDKIINEYLPLLTNDTGYENKWQVNSRPLSDHINIYIIDSSRLDNRDIPEHLIRNCAYIGRPQIVICDLNLLRRFSKDVYQRMGVNFSEYNVADDIYMTIWVIGHEIGHIINNHGLSHFSKSIVNEEGESSATHEQELEADAFVANQVSDSKEVKDDLVRFYADIVKLFVSDYQTESLHGPGIPVFADQEIITDSSGSHPEYILRAVSMMNSLGAKDYPEYKSDLEGINELLKYN
jgi:hypothetical protein